MSLGFIRVFTRVCGFLVTSDAFSFDNGLGRSLRRFDLFLLAARAANPIMWQFLLYNNSICRQMPLKADSGLVRLLFLFNRVAKVHG